jgi:hypothetical protein
VYRCVAASAAGFIQQLAVSYVGHGYFFYAAGEIPAGKDPQKTDRKIIEQYGIDISKWARARRKRAGLANLHYLRFERFYVIIATHGEHEFFLAEAKRLKDIRETPIRFQGYSISYRRAWGRGAFHPSVRLERERYLELKAYFEELAVHRTVERLIAEFQALELELYAPVRNQLFMILRAVNRRRKAAGFEPVPSSALKLFRRSARVFEGGSQRAKRPTPFHGSFSPAASAAADTPGSDEFL